MQAQPLGSMAQPQKPEVALWHQRGDPTAQRNQGLGTKCTRRREIWNWWLGDVLGQRDPRNKLVGRVGEAVHAIPLLPLVKAGRCGHDMGWGGSRE